MFSRDVSPDYASSTHSEKPQPETKKPGGVRKVIGDPNYAPIKRSSLVPDFDFGVTQSLTPVSSRPGSAIGRRSPRESPPPSAPQTPLETRKQRVDRASPGHINPLPSPHSRPSSRQMWQPGLVTGHVSPGGLSAEEFVQQRAAMARLPGGYVPRRTLSSNKIEELKTPSPDQSRARLQKRHSSRPSSRGSLLDFSSSTLSAREQEHVARMTGGPLLRLGDHSSTPDPHIGLIGAISSREQDKRNMKEGVSGYLVQAAIAQRQQQAEVAYQQQMQAQHQAGVSAWSQPQYVYPMSSGYFPQQHQFQQQQQQFYQYPQHPVQQTPYGQYHHQPDNHAYPTYYASQQGYRRQ